MRMNMKNETLQEPEIFIRVFESVLEFIPTCIHKWLHTRLSTKRTYLIDDEYVCIYKLKAIIC